jgi:hypothetical protein
MTYSQTIQCIEDPLITSKQQYYDIKYIEAIESFLIQFENKTEDKNYLIKKLSAFIFLLLYVTQLDINDILTLKKHDLTSILKKGYTILNYTKKDKKKYLLKLNNTINIKEFSFLYEDLLKLKEDDHLLFSSVLNPYQKLRKNNILISLNNFCLELNKKNDINFDLNDFLNSNIFSIINYNIDNN